MSPENSGCACKEKRGEVGELVVERVATREDGHPEKWPATLAFSVSVACAAATRKARYDCPSLP